ncbi:8-oxo-dGTP diphosphatase [Reichenbachiella faecimaris]|uniref:8-oxo-dGTP diphosphatase n=1 Tax=Reichenbachiella faecimaris TaxID=692418 RepID=A0A1W2GQU8_REIFA|nr:NUDIX domain-containing protein [Reichenbachiella faecimaris]SMD38792.1 8-oxo-dGTP diphosphatase [Reichenbachiella faecimaris]
MGSEEIKSIFGNKVRVRVMGVLVQDQCVLLLNHSGLNDEDELWLPPGGGVEFGEHSKEALIREFKEEVNIPVKICDFLGVNEFISDELHAVELFFVVEQIGGKLRLGDDPEMSGNSILKEARWMNIQSLKQMNKNCLHGLFHGIESLDDLFDKQGFFNIGNNP